MKLPVETCPEPLATVGAPPSGALLVGSLSLASAEHALATCATTLGSHLHAIPDGEPGERTQWIVCLAVRVFHGHPAITTVARPAPIDGVEQWMPTSVEDMWGFEVRDRAGLRFDDLHYARDAAESYAVFTRLRDAGVIAPGTRFQVSLPSTESIIVFFRDPADFVAVRSAFHDALRREVTKLVAAVPAEDLLIQWDVCIEILMDEGVMPWAPPGVLNRHVAATAELSDLIPPAVELGYHFCWGDIAHCHVVEPVDLTVATMFANHTVAAVGRRVDYVHMPVPRSRTDDRYFAPLASLDIGDTALYLGLVHATDGLDGARARMATAARHVDQFGIATECGLGRRKPEHIVELLLLHAELLAVGRR